MNKIEALQKIKDSLETVTPQVITPVGKVYEDYVKELSETLINSLIEPVRVTVISTCAQEGDFLKYKNSIVWGIAKNKGNWLLTLEKEPEFALGFGENPKEIKMHGFSSQDALGEWCA